MNGIEIQNFDFDNLGAFSDEGWKQLWAIAAAASIGASAYHGYKRNQSVGWAVIWGVLGGLFPIITPAIALGQGFGVRR
jgi:hypothetical protein